MSIDRLNQTFIELTCEGGLRTIVKVSAIQAACERDATGSDITLLLGGGREYDVIGSLDELREALQQEPLGYGALRRPTL